MRSLLNNRLRLIAIATVFVVAVVAGFIFFYNQLRSRSKAAPTGTAELSLIAVNNPPMDGNGNIRIGVQLDPNGSSTTFHSFDVQVTYDSSKLEFQNTGGVDANVFLTQGSLKAQVTQVDANTIRIVGTRTSAPFSSSSKRVADITFKMKSGQNFPLAFSWGSTALQSTAYVKVPLNLSNNSQTSSTSSGAGGVSLSFATGAPSYEVGNLVQVDIMLNTAGKQIAKTNVNFAYDQAKLTYVSTIINTNTFNGTNNTPAASGGVVTFRAERNGSITGSLRVATVRFTAKAVGTANLTFNKTSSSVMTYGTNAQNVLATVNNSSVVIVAQGAGASSSVGGGGGGGGGGNGTPGEHLESNGDILHINSATFDRAPVRYEQEVKLDKGAYILSGGARVYTVQGRGVLITLACAEANCGDGKVLNSIIGQTPLFAKSTDFQRKEATVHISDNQKNKRMMVRIFVEDGSEADFDFVSLTDVWGGEKLTNWHFENTYKAASPRYYPQYWDMDTAGQVLSTVDKLQGTDGSLFINSSSRK